MATRGTSGAKEKRGTSPSAPLTKKSPRPSSSSSSSSPAEDKPLSPTDGKPVPNYLRPTASSLPKKSVTDSSAAQKPGLNRRRSFDRPPPAAQVQKAIRNAPAAREIKPLRSSSFSNKTGPSASSSRPASDKTYARTSSSAKDSKAEPQFTKSRSLKKSTLSSGGAKKELNGTPSSSTKKKASKSVTSESSDYDNPTADQLAAEDDLVNIDSEVQSLPEISEMPGDSKELGDPTLTDVEVKSAEDVQENSVADEEKHNLEDKPEPVDQVAEETVEQQTATPDQNHEEKEEQVIEISPEQKTVEASAVDQPEVEAEEQKLPSEEAKIEAAKEEVIAELTETLTEEKKEEAAVEQEGAEKAAKDTEAKGETQSDAAPAEASSPAVSSPAKQPTSAGKKEKQDYNDVIEKSVRGKKGVLALAGAFETVISLDKS